MMEWKNEKDVTIQYNTQTNTIDTISGQTQLEKIRDNFRIQIGRECVALHKLDTTTKSNKHSFTMDGVNSSHLQSNALLCLH